MGNCSKYTEETLQMKKRVEDFFSAEFETAHTTRITSLVAPEFVDCCAEERTLTLAFTVSECMLNPTDTMMGGVIATAFDTTAGTLVYILGGTKIAPTLSMTLNFIKPIVKGDRLIVTARAQSYGKRIVHTSVEGVSERYRHICATATAVFLSPELL